MQEISTGNLVSFDSYEEAAKFRESGPEEFGPILHVGMKVTLSPKGSSEACTFMIHTMGKSFVTLRPISLAVYEK
jgi:hypothetical protein